MIKFNNQREQKNNNNLKKKKIALTQSRVLKNIKNYQPKTKMQEK